MKIKKIYRKMEKKHNENEFFLVTEKTKIITDQEAKKEIKEHYNVGDTPLIVNDKQTSFTTIELGINFSVYTHYWYYTKED